MEGTPNTPTRQGASLQQMRGDWDARAREDARHFIATGESEGLAFDLSGLRDAATILEDVHPYLRAEARVLEIGCGIGRLMQYMAQMFAQVTGVDASEEMVARSRAFLAFHPNTHTLAGSGDSLQPLSDNSQDFVYSYVVLQHLPEKELIRGYFRETCRVLAPGGIFKLHVKTRPWEGQVGYDTWNGVEVTLEDIEAWALEMGFELLNAYSHDATTAWVVGRCA